MCSTTIIVIHTHFQNAMILKNYFFMARRMCVQPSLLARLATVLVLLFSWRGISCPSSYSSSRKNTSNLLESKTRTSGELSVHGRKY